MAKTFQKMITMSLDPGLHSAGYAIWEGKRLRRAGRKTSRDKDWVEAGEQVAAQLHSVAARYKVKKVWCELPAFHQSPKGLVTARSGALVKLCWCVGFIHGTFRLTPFLFVPVYMWKGQLPKEIVNNRIRGILPRKIWRRFDKDTWDAVGIGLYVHGRMK